MTDFLHSLRPPCMHAVTAAFSEKARHEFPRNVILMGIFTVGEGILVGAATSRYQTDIVLLALGITAAVTFSLMTFALTTKNDFTSMGSYLYAALLSLFVAGLVGMVLRTPLLTLAISTGGAALFSMCVPHGRGLARRGMEEEGLACRGRPTRKNTCIGCIWAVADFTEPALSLTSTLPMY